MITRNPKICISLGAIVLVSGIACSSTNWQTDQTSCANPAPSASGTEQTPASGCPDTDMRMFGRVTSARTVSFEGKLAANAQQHTAPVEGADFDPDVDPAGQYLVFSSTRHSRFSHLYMKRIGGTTLTQLTDESGNDAQPRFSPSGDRVAFASDRSGQWDIWVVDANGRNPVQITRHSLPELHPSWSPDGNRLVYCRINPRENRSELWVVDLTNPGVKRVIGEGMFPAWSPKGDKIAYQRARARGSRRFSLWTVEVDEKNDAMFPTEIASSGDAALIAPTWSPDATQLAFAVIAPSSAGPSEDGSSRVVKRGYSDIGLIDADGQGLIRLTNGKGKNYSPVWANDGHIYFISRMENNTEAIWSVKPYQPALRNTPSAVTTGQRAALVSDEDR